MKNKKSKKVSRKPNGYWTLENCKKDALQYKHRKEWSKASSGAYQSARKNDWLEECCSHMEFLHKPKGYWNLKNCKKDALQYKNRKEWKNASVSMYNSAQKNGWLEECCSHMAFLQKPNGTWNLKNCKKDALQYKHRSEWQKASKSAYSAAHKNDWLEECCSHMKPLGSIKMKGIYVFKWPNSNSVYAGNTYNFDVRYREHISGTKQIIEADKIEPHVFKTLYGGKFFPAEIAIKKEEALRLKYTKEGYNVLNKSKCYSLGGGFLKWDLENCKKDALKYKHRSEWVKASGSAYTAAHRNDWLEECCSHMELLCKPNGYWDLENCKKDALQYKHRKEWYRASGGAYTAAHKNDWLEECCSHMEYKRKHITLEQAYEK